MLHPEKILGHPFFRPILANRNPEKQVVISIKYDFHLFPFAQKPPPSSPCPGDTGTSLSRSSNMGSTLGRSSEAWEHPGTWSSLRYTSRKPYGNHMETIWKPHGNHIDVWNNPTSPYFGKKAWKETLVFLTLGPRRALGDRQNNPPVCHMNIQNASK